MKNVSRPARPTDRPASKTTAKARRGRMTAPARAQAQSPVLCGTDFSIHAAEAADVAAALARLGGRSLVLVHAVDQPVVNTGSPQDHPELLGRIPDRVAAEADRLSAQGTTVRHQVIAGSPHQGVVEAAERDGASLIVVGSIGQIAPSRLLVGSAAERTAETAPVPTLVVRQPGPLKEWAAGRRRLKVMIAHDFSTTADRAVAWAAQLGELGTCDLTMAHVDWLPGELQRLGIPGPISLTENPPVVTAVLERELRERVAPWLNGHPAALHVSPGWGRTAEHLIEIARAKEIDLLVVGTHQRQGLNRLHLGSVSRGILRHAPMNVAVVPLPAADATQAPAGGAGATGVPPAILPFQRALVPTDFSDLANRAIATACAALPRGGTVHLLHIASPDAPDTTPRGGKRTGSRPTKPNASDAAPSTAQLAARLRALIPSGADTLGLRFEIEVLKHEHVARAICQEAERVGAHVICLGSHGRSGLSRALLGSVAHDVMHGSSRPVLVVRPPKA